MYEFCIDDEDFGEAVFASSDAACNSLMALGLYRLGFKEEWAWRKLRPNELEYPFTNHEKLEFQLAMPREFWPQKWLDEESANY